MGVVMNEHTDPYAVLGVTPAASPADISHAFRVKLRALHPDTRYAGTAPGAEAQLRQLLAAYNQLRYSGRRTDADPEPAASTSPQPSAAEPRHTAPSSQGPTKIPVNHRTPSNAEPLWAGPVRRLR